MKNFNLRNIPNEFHKNIKEKAANKNITMEKFIMDAIKKELERKQ